MFYQTRFMNEESAREMVMGTTADTAVVALFTESAMLNSDVELITEAVHKVLSPVANTLWGQYNGHTTIKRAIKWMEIHEIASFDSNRFQLLKSKSEVEEMLIQRKFGAKFNAPDITALANAVLIVKPTQKTANLW